jgi:hypothetical protein
MISYSVNRGPEPELLPIRELHMTVGQVYILGVRRVESVYLGEYGVMYVFFHLEDTKQGPPIVDGDMMVAPTDKVLKGMLYGGEGEAVSGSDMHKFKEAINAT